MLGDDDDDDDYNPCEDYMDDPSLRDALRNRAAQDTIRRVHLIAPYHHLDLIICLLTANRGEPRPNGVESIILRNESFDPVDVSCFFAGYHFPKLRRLELNHFTTSSWDHLTSRTSVLTTLELDFDNPSPTPTTSQLHSILASNPALQKVVLTNHSVPDDGGGESSVRVHLPHLKELRLDGGLRQVIRLLDKLDHPRNMDNLSLTLRDSDVTEISQIVGPYLRHNLQRRDRPQNRPNLRVVSGDCLGPWVDDAVRINLSIEEGGWIYRFVAITVVLPGAPRRTAKKRAALEFLAYAPLDEVIYFHMVGIPITMEGIRTRFPNLRTLSFEIGTPAYGISGPKPDRRWGGVPLPGTPYIRTCGVGWR